ncbi:MAG: hypothetical protein LBC99_06255 [Spirochaetota bacterium]|nr:hypothetical protein [Spirochaetota bacterium]
MRLLPVLIFCFCAVCAILLGAAGASPIPDAGVPIMPASEVKKGMQGYGLTVFEGSAIERFNAEIVGVLYNTGARSDLILARLSGGPLAETGVISGMSGSPVYIEGKLIGAVAYAWGMTKSAIAGITPIQEMLDTFSFEGRPAPRPFKMEKATNTEINGLSYPQQGLNKVATPLVIAGIHPEVYPQLAKAMESEGFLPIPGGEAGSGVTAEQANLRLAPGSAVGVQLVGGDISMTGIGTVTWVGSGKDANAVLAFGHPMMMRGDSSFPMTTAWIHTVMPSYNVSFKIGSSLASVGAIQQDRAAAIGGRVGVPADTIPVKLAFQIGDRNRGYTLSFIRDPQLFARLFSSTVQSIILENSAQYGLITLGIEYAFTLRETKSGRRETIRIKDGFASLMSSAAWQASLQALVQPIMEAIFSERVDAAIDDIAITITALPEIAAVEISGIAADRKKVRPGDLVTLTVELTPWHEKPFYEKVQIKVPEDTANAKIFFIASSTAAERYWDRYFGEGKYDHYSFDSLVRALSINHDPTELAIWTELSQLGIVAGDEHLPNLPDSRFLMLARSNTPRMRFLNGRLRSLNPTSHFLYGMQYVVLDMTE